MKKHFIYALLIILFFGCDTDEKQITQPNDIESSLLVISIPAIMLDKSFGVDELFKNTTPEDFKAMWNLDKEVHRRLVENKSIGKFTLTRKINPCCPCSTSEPTCCMCLETMSFASPTSMNASVQLVDSNGNATPLSKNTFESDGIDLFTITSDTSDGNYSLVVTMNEPSGRLNQKPFTMATELKQGNCNF